MIYIGTYKKGSAVTNTRSACKSRQRNINLACVTASPGRQGSHGTTRMLACGQKLARCPAARSPLGVVVLCDPADFHS